MYKTSTRAGVLSTTGMSTNYVISCELQTERKPETWTLAGAALLCMLNVRVERAAARGSFCFSHIFLYALSRTSLRPCRISETERRFRNEQKKSKC
jgi:hypothetical protein